MHPFRLHLLPGIWLVYLEVGLLRLELGPLWIGLDWSWFLPRNRRLYGWGFFEQDKHGWIVETPIAAADWSYGGYRDYGLRLLIFTVDLALSYKGVVIE